MDNPRTRAPLPQARSNTLTDRLPSSVLYFSPMPAGPRSQTPSVKAALIAPVILTLVALAIAGGLMLTEYRRLAAYTPTPATILSSDVKKTRDSRASGGYSYSPLVRYEYRVSDRTFTSDIIFPIGPTAGFFANERDWASSIVKRYPPGSTTTAYVNTNHPTYSFLEREQSNKPFYIIIFGLMFSVSWYFQARRGPPYEKSPIP